MVANSIVSNLFQIYCVHAEKARENLYEDETGPNKVLIGGGTGFIGTELCKTLKRKGYKAVIVSRTASGRGEGDRITYADLKEFGLPQNTKAVVNLAGQNVLDCFNRWTDTFKTKVYDSRISTAKAFKEAIESSPKGRRPEVFVQITGVGYFPPSNDIVYNENTAVEDSKRDYFSRLVQDWESAATLSPSSGVRNVFVRPAVVLGRQGGMIQQIFLPFFMGVGGRMGAGNQPMAWVHVKDLCGIIVHAVENDKVEGVLNAVAPQIITNQEFVSAFGSALHRPVFFPLPDTVWNLVFGQERATMITKGQKVTPTRTLESGYTFRFPTISEACQEFAQLMYQDVDE